MEDTDVTKQMQTYKSKVVRISMSLCLMFCLVFVIFASVHSGSHDFLWRHENYLTQQLVQVKGAEDLAARTPGVHVTVPPFIDFQHRTNCSVRLLKDRKQLRRADREKPLCGYKMFKDYFSKHDAFYSAGDWLQGSKSGGEFVPDDCDFVPGFTHPKNFSSHIRRQGLKYVLITGDSNGWRFFNAVLGLFQRGTDSCRVTRQERDNNGRRDTRYFQVPAVPLTKMQGHSRGCSYCKSHVYQCKYTHDGKPETVRVEFITMTHFIDSTLRVTYDNKGNFDLRRHSADTLIEYLLKYYFKHWGSPDLWALYAPIHHETWGRDLEEYETHLNFFLDLLELKLPNNSRLMLLTDNRECPAKRPDSLNTLIKDIMPDGSRNKKIHRMNNMLFQVLKPILVKPHSRIYGFLDLGELSCPVTCLWHADGAHMKQFWYDQLGKYMFQVLFNDDEA